MNKLKERLNKSVCGVFVCVVSVACAYDVFASRRLNVCHYRVPTYIYLNMVIFNAQFSFALHETECLLFAFLLCFFVHFVLRVSMSSSE